MVEEQMAGTGEGYDVREQMDVGQEAPRHEEANTDMLNGVPEAARAESGPGQMNGEEEGAQDTEMAGTG